MKHLIALPLLIVCLACTAAAVESGQYFLVQGSCYRDCEAELKDAVTVNPQNIAWVKGMPFSRDALTVRVFDGTGVAEPVLYCGITLHLPQNLADKLHALATVRLGERIGQEVQVALLIVVYSSGEQTELPLIMGVNVANSEWDRSDQADDRAHEWVPPATTSTSRYSETSWKWSEFYVLVELRSEPISEIGLQYTYSPSEGSADRPSLHALEITVSAITLEQGAKDDPD